MTREQATEAVRAAREGGAHVARAGRGGGPQPRVDDGSPARPGDDVGPGGGRRTEVLGLGDDVAAALQRPPRGLARHGGPGRSAIYRFHEITQIYGTTIKELIHEEFGDGIMSAIDFEMRIERRPDPKGDRVVVTYDGKFLPYRVW